MGAPEGDFCYKIVFQKSLSTYIKNSTFLGIVIDEFLTWRDHFDLVATKLIKCTDILKVRNFTSLNSLKLIYYELVHPYLIHGNLIWGNTLYCLVYKSNEYSKKGCKVNES